MSQSAVVGGQPLGDFHPPQGIDSLDALLFPCAHQGTGGDFVVAGAGVGAGADADADTGALDVGAYAAAEMPHPGHQLPTLAVEIVQPWVPGGESASWRSRCLAHFPLSVHGQQSHDDV